ncbi:MAG TPA: hypothetical protein VK469_15785, partial [Candidatus Kapabacteria bacterium]|nr:hypothetical protein [Candidatus Kapabacteria bacterium]
ISGRIVTQNGRGVKGVTLAFSPSKTSTVSDSSGYYRHAVNPKWSGTVRPTKTGYCFDPDEIELTNVDMDYSLKNITANLSSRNLAGKVTVFGEGVAEVTLTFTNPNGKNETAMTDSNGFYSHKVPYGWFGTVTPSKEQLLFDPPNKRYERPGVIKDRNDENYQLKISLALLVDRRKDNTMIISKEYAKIELNLDPKKNYDDVQKFIIERKESGPGASEPKKIDISKEEGKNSYIYIDEYLEHAKTYTYIAKAINAYDNLIDLSNKVIVK